MIRIGASIMFNKWLLACAITGLLVLTACTTPVTSGKHSNNVRQEKAPALFRASNRASGERQIWQVNRAGDKLSPFPIPGNTNTGNADIGNLVSFGDFAIFMAYHPEYGRELWRTDGTGKGTYLLKDTLPGPASGMNENPLTSARTEQGEVFFWNSTAQQMTLWKTDGTTQGTFALKNFPRSTGAKLQNSTIPRLVVLGKRAFFRADDGQHGAEFWHSDGTKAGTKLLLDASKEVPDNNGFIPSMGSLRNSGFKLTERYLYFTTRSLVHHDQKQPFSTTLWRVSRNAAKAVKVKQLSANETRPTRLLYADEENIYYYRNVANSGQTDIWLLDLKSGNARNARRIGRIGRKENLYGSNLYSPLKAGDFLYFRNDSMDSAEIWRTDGIKIQHVFTGPYDERNYFSKQHAFADQVFFAASSPHDASPSHLFVWHSDSKSLKPEPAAIRLDQKEVASYLPMQQDFFFEVNNHLLFSIPDEQQERPVVHAISKESPQKISVMGRFDSFIPIASPLDQKSDVLLFINGDEIWQTDGSLSGTKRITKFTHPQKNWQRNRSALNGLGQSQSAVMPVRLNNGRLLFSLHDRRYGSELWVSDNTTQGTKLVKDINTSPTGPEVSDMVQTSNGWYFVREGNLWFSDGTQANTKAIRGIPQHQKLHLTLVATNALAAIKAGQYAYILTRQKANLPDNQRAYTLWRLDHSRAIKLQTFNSSANIFAGESGIYIRQFFTDSDNKRKQHRLALWKVTDAAQKPTLLLQTSAKPFQQYLHVAGTTKNGFLYSMQTTATGAPDTFFFNETTRTSTQLDAPANSQYFNTGQRLLRLTAPLPHNAQSASIAEFDVQKLTFNTLEVFPNLGEFYAVPTDNGLFISVYKHEQPKFIWYLGDDQQTLQQVKQFPPEQSVRLAKFIKPHLYLNVVNNQDILSLTHEFTEVWISDGTPTGTRKIADGMQLD